jgi:hypothetical protein
MTDALDGGSQGAEEWINSVDQMTIISELGFTPTGTDAPRNDISGNLGALDGSGSIKSIGSGE